MDKIWIVRQLCSYGWPFGWIARKIYSLIQVVYGSQVPWFVLFGGKPCFPHGMYGVFISGAAKIGKGAVIFQHVTIGSNALPDSKGFGAPTIGDDCMIGAGAAIIGNVRIGNRVRIGANAVVSKDIDDDSVVISTGTVIQKNKPNDNTYYICHGRDRWDYFDDGQWKNVEDRDLLDVLNDFGRSGMKSKECVKQNSIQ